MGTKTNPSTYDCHAKAKPDEPLFTLLARDRIAPLLVGLWVAVRTGDKRNFERCILRLTVLLIQSEPKAEDVAKALEALSVATEMCLWRQANRPADEAGKQEG